VLDLLFGEPVFFERQFVRFLRREGEFSGAEIEFTITRWNGRYTAYSIEGHGEVVSLEYKPSAPNEVFYPVLMIKLATNLVFDGGGKRKPRAKTAKKKAKRATVRESVP
jgi:hypothetical protein